MNFMSISNNVTKEAKKKIPSWNVYKMKKEIFFRFVK